MNPTGAPVTQGESELPASSQLLGELLVERRLASRQDIAKALAFQQQYGGRIGSILVRLGALSEESLLPVLSEQLGIDLLASDEWPEDAAAVAVAGPSYFSRAMESCTYSRTAGLCSHH